MLFFDFLAPVLGFIMEWIVRYVPVYGWALVIFTVISKLVMLPLSIKQQKSMAYNSAYSAPMKEIQEKYKDDRNKMNEELMAFQKDHGISMTAGCLPMLVNMLVLFGLIDVLYYPLQNIFSQSTDAINKAAAHAGFGTFNAEGVFKLNEGVTANIMESSLLARINESPAEFEQFFNSAVNEMANLDFLFLGLDLTASPALNNPVTLILPIITVVSMVAIQIITPKLTGQEMPGSMKYMPWILGATFGWFCFTVPVAFSLYYALSNILMFIQSYFLRKLYDPKKIKAQVEEELAQKRKEKKKKKEFVVKNDKGESVVKSLTQSEQDKLRMERARAMDLEKYGEE